MKKRFMLYAVCFVFLITLFLTLTLSHNKEKKEEQKTEQQLVQELSVDDISVLISNIKNGDQEFDVLDEGEYYGVQWTVTSDGILLLSGTDHLGNETYENAPWKEYKFQIVGAYVNIQEAKTLEALFGDMETLVYVDVTEMDTSKVVSMSSMFYRCYKLTELDLSALKTSNVTDMKQMFMSVQL